MKTYFYMVEYMYFFIYYSRKVKENPSDVHFTEPEKKSEKPECFYSEDEYKNKKYYYKKIFKTKSSGKQKNKFAFIIGEDKYEISFDSQGSKFIYDVTLEYGLRIIKVRRKIPQNKIEYKDKLDFFKKSLEENREEEKIDELYKDTIDLYSKKKGFNLLIPLFLKIYQKKNLCQLLLKKFKETDEKAKQNNMDRKADLKDYTSQFGEIISEAGKLIKDNEYNPIDFYGIILCYTNSYDKEKFSQLVDKLSNKKPEDLFEIMLIYRSHFINQINVNFDFFNKFISYAIEKNDFSILKIVLSYIKDLETYINVIEKNQKDIFDKFSKQINENNIIKIDKSLKLKKVENTEENINVIKSPITKKDNKEEIKSASDKDENKELEYIQNFESIIDFSKEKNIIFIYFTNDFWKYIINCYKKPTINNIEMCFKLRKIFVEYKNLVETIIPSNNKSAIRKDAIECYKNDEFAFLLDQIIRSYIDNNQDLKAIDKLSLITEYNPYYKIKEYPKKVDTNIFNLINLDDIDEAFIRDFRNLNFELIFEAKLVDYIKTITSKIKKISNFDIVINLINIENIKIIENKNILIYLEYLKKKYDIIKKEVEDDLQTLTSKKLEEAVKVVDSEILKSKKLDEDVKVIIDLALLNFAYEKEEKKFDFFKNIIIELPKNIIPLIFIEIINKCVTNEENKEDENADDEDNDEDDDQEDIKFSKDIDFEKMRKYIFGIIVNEVKDDNDINNIIKVIDCIKGELNKVKDKENNDNYDQFDTKQKESVRDKILDEFFNELMDKNLFTKEEFFTHKHNIKISLLYKLNEGKKIKESEKDYYKEIIKVINNIYKEITDGNIKKKKLEEFLNNDDIEKRLSLINLIYENYKPGEVLSNLKEKIKNINKNMEILKVTKDNIMLYYKEREKDLIKELIKIIKDSENQKINEYNEGGRLYELIKKCNGLEKKIKEIEEVKGFLLFNIIYEMNSGANEETNFINTKKELNDIGKLINEKNIDELYKKKYYIIDKIISKLRKNEKENKEFIEKLINYYKIKDESLIDDLTILFKSEKYEFDINSMIFFFKCLNKENENWDNNDLIQKLEQNKDLSAKEFENTKKKLLELKDEKMKIYDYKNIGEYNKLFTCLYDKKEAIDFLIDKIDKIDENIEDLKRKIDPTNTTIKTENILDTKVCIQCINEMKEKKDYKKILIYIQNLKKKIEKFVNYSKNYSQIIELDRYYNPKENIYEEVERIIKKELTLNIFQDSEHFFYFYENKKENKFEKIEITMEKLINLKNKIPPKTENDEDNIKSKSKTLIFFKDLITNLEKINEYMKVLRTKGSSLPVKISIKVLEMYNIEYYLDGKKETLINIENRFLSPAKNTYIAQLKSEYEKNPNIRLLYGKQFRSMMRHLEDGLNIDSFLRYIINNTDNKRIIKEGDKGIIRTVNDYIKHYKEYNEGSLESISKYINSLFKNNDKNLEDHYDEMKIISENIYKGIYVHKCKKNCSMEEFIINLFWDKLDKLPIAQNVLITSKETSDEEMQSFFYRAILCNYNTLFVVGINDSISEYQQSIMNAYISQLLSKKNKNKKENKEIEGNENFNKKNTKNYLDSCVVFVYEEENKNKITSFLKEINKLEYQNFENDISLNAINSKKNNYKSKLDNIKVITSDICGLGKSGKIRKEIKDKSKKCFHFPLGGILTKNIIFNKLETLLNKIKNENYNDVAIHLDLTESEEKSILNEFFFSFLITKFYTNNENILYIPKDICIYIEIPNCFESYLDKFSILNIFNKDNITFDNMEPLNYPKKMIEIFNRMLGKKAEDNEEIKKFVKKYIGIEKCSYHQINIFINLFISQYNKFETKLYFYHYELDNKGQKVEKDITDKCIEEFAKCTQYFTNGGFSKLLTGEIKSNKKKYIDKLSEIYDNDLNNMEFPSPLIFIIKEKNTYDKLMIPKRNSKEYKNSKDYLNRIKEILDLPNEVEKDVEKDGIKYKSLLSIIEEKNNNYVITNDNFKKMVLLVYRIKANVPVIIMGDTGCGKTALITKLNQILNNGETTVQIENIHPGINDEKLCEIMKEKDDLAKEKGNKELWLFFDEINTCPSLSLITEIFINRTYYGNPISDNIRLIGACNPYRKRKGNKEKCGLSFSDDNDDELVYLVNPLPQSLLYYVFSFGRIDDEDEKKYIKSIIEKIFPIEEKRKLKQLNNQKKKELEEKKQTKNSDVYSHMKNEEKENLKKEIKSLEVEIKTIERELKYHEITTEAISQCHKYLRKTYDASVVSLREIARFPKLVEFFKFYFRKKNEYEHRDNNEKNNKIRSIICSIYLCYYIRLTEDFKRTNFEQELRSILLQLVTYEETKPGNLKEQIQIEELKTEIESRPKEKIEKNFSDFLKIEQDYLIKQIKPDKGIGKNTLLKENTFLLFVSVITNLPLIIIGKPGTGKSLSVQLINKSLKGEYSNKKFFKIYPKIIQTYFQGSLSTNTIDVENLFKKLGDKLIFYKKLREKNPNIKLPISVACFDELGLAERSKNNPLKRLHPELDFAGKKENESFVGISNYSLDAAKLNRALVLSVPDLDQKKDELIATARKIVKSIAPKKKDEKIFEILSNTYFEYKRLLQFIKELVVYRKYYKKYIKGKETLTQKGSSMNIVNKGEKINEKIEMKVEEENKPQELDINKNLEEKNRANSFISKDSEQEGNDEMEKNGKGTFESIRQKQEFKELMKKDNKIRKDFHGNRDFYNLIKGIAYALRNEELGDNEKVNKIIKCIERNFGGIEYVIHINFDLILDDIREEIDKLKEILQEYTSDIKNPIKLNSVYLFKKLYNLKCQELDKDGNLQIDKNDIKKYNLNICINDNIGDINSRYLLLEIKQSLTPLIVQNIKLENPYKEKILLYDGSPFPNDDNNDYRFKKISEIRDDAKDDKLIIIENLDQIHPFLFDLYNMNYEIIDEEKYARICLDSFRELKTLVNDRFRIIILVDERFVNKCDLAFLNRLEKMILSFENLLDDDLKKKSENIIKGIDLKHNIEDFEKSNANYSLQDLLINCGDQEIQGLIYYYSKYYKKNENDDDSKGENINEIDLKEKVINKIYKILPQDIISILGKNNDIKKKYYKSKNIHNFKGYLEEMKKEENKDYKISIIYTFTSIANMVEGLDKEMSFMISQIKSENEFKSLIEEKKKNNNNLQKKYIFIHFEQSNSKNIKFISNFILNNFIDDYKYIIIIHINRSFNKVKDINKNSSKETIYSLPDINPKIDQMFIDNLNGNDKIALKDLLDENENDMKNIIIKLKDELKLDEEFNKVLTNFLREELEKKYFENKDKNEKYIKEIQIYMDDEKDIKNKIIEVAYKINDNLDDDENNSDIIENIHKKKMINQFTVDIVSCLIEYIKEEVFIKNLKNTFQILEDNNILTTLIEIQKRKYDSINQNLVEEIVMDYLDEMTVDKNYNYECKFLYNYNIPGFYNFFIYLSNYISQNITSGYFNNEKTIRVLLNNDLNKINVFHEKEELFLKIVYKEISENHKFIFDKMEKITDDIFFKDYINYYLQKYRNNKDIYKIDDIYHKIIVLLLKLRFNDENSIIKSENNFQIQLIKIIWIESNVNYILNILKIIDTAIIIFDNDENKLYKEIEKLYKEDSNKYITNDKKNPEITKEVNQCYYILLAIICYSITSDKIKNEKLDQYYNNLKVINKILLSLNDELLIFLNEMYIIDELIKIIEIFKKKNNINKINDIKDYIRENADIIQKYSNNKDLSDKLIENFEKIYKEIIEDENIYKDDKDYYDNLRYILYKEIKKNNDVDYRLSLLEKLLEHNIMIKKSNDIFQIILKKYLNKKNLKENEKYLIGKSNEVDNIINLIENNLINNIVLDETLLYLFEKNSLNYYKIKQVNLEDEPLKLLIVSIEFLDNYINKPKEIKSKIKEFWKLFSLGYIKTYCYTMFNNTKLKLDKPENIIKNFNNENSICRMIRIYIYKILYNNYTIDYLKDGKNKNKYGLDKLKDFEEFIKIKELSSNIYKIDYKIKTLKDEEYKTFNEDFENFEKNNFNNKIKARDYNVKENGIDNFYVTSFNSILANLLSKTTKVQEKFYDNICNPLFKGNDTVLKAIELFYNPKKFSEIKKQYNITSNFMKPLLYGYRYCLNELSTKNTKGIYYPLYDDSKLKYLKDKYYPGNDTKLNLVYSDIINHFKTKPDEGCYVCLCDNLYYHSIPSGFPGKNELDMTCPKCKKNIGTTKKGTDIIIVKRDKYYRIFKNEEEIEKTKKNKLNEINYMTLKEFIEKIMTKSFQKEKGVYSSDKNSFKNNNKIVRNLSQISYRLLNFILYSHLFFAKLITDKKDFDKYLPKGNTWEETINECWNMLKNELSKIDIFSIEKFMNYIFVNLFPILNKEECIDKYEKLIEFEDKLETEIQKLINNFEQYYKNLIDTGDRSSLINLITEKYNSGDYKEEDYPFYQFFYYTSYLDEKYINEKICHEDGNKYPVLKMYLEYKMNDKPDKYKYIVDNMHTFNNALNLISQKYFNNISKDDAEKTMLKDAEIYTENMESPENSEQTEKKKNKDLFDKFSAFYNKLKIDEIKNKNKLNNDNHLSDFFVRDDNEYGRNYKKIYQTFIKQQNEKIINLFEKKGMYDINTQNKVNVQQINEDDIFNLNIPKKTSFIDILFDCSYRKIIDTDPMNYNSYKEYTIDYDLIEENMTDLLLNNKKLLNETITEFIYNNELFSNQITNLFTLFKENYICTNIILDDKVTIYKFCTENNTIHKEMIKDFIILIKYLNDNKKENNNNEEKIIQKETKIYEIVDKLNDKSKYFIKLFEKNESLTVDKTLDIFEYYLKAIYNDVSSEIKEYQEDLDDKSKEKINKFYEKKRYISKEDLAYSIRLFITLVLYREEDKENKIQTNHNNAINYLRSQDLWKYNIDNNEKFLKEFDALKLMNIQINQIISLYELLGKDIEDKFFDDVKKKDEEEEPAEEDENNKEEEKSENIENDNNSENDNNGENDMEDEDEIRD